MKSKRSPVSILTATSTTTISGTELHPFWDHKRSAHQTWLITYFGQIYHRLIWWLTSPIGCCAHSNSLPHKQHSLIHRYMLYYMFTPPETPDWICTRSATCTFETDYYRLRGECYSFVAVLSRTNSWLAVRSIPGVSRDRRIPAPTGNVKIGLNSHLASITPRALEHLHAVDPISRPADPIHLARVCESFPKTHFCSRCSPYSVRFGRKRMR